MERLKEMLRRLAHKILHPDFLTTICVSLVSVPFFLFILRTFYFIWFVPFFWNFLLFMVLLIVIAFAFRNIDRHYKTSLLSYAAIWIFLFIGLWLISVPVKDILIEKTETRGMILIKKIETFKNMKGKFPPDLNSDYFKGVPKRTLIGTSFVYEKSKTVDDYCLTFKSLSGYTGIYNRTLNCWTYFD